MGTIQSIFQQALLAEAAYANFWDSDLNALITDREDVRKNQGVRLVDLIV